MVIDRDGWKDIKKVLKKYGVEYTTHYDRRDIQRSMATPDITVDDLHVSIHLVVPDYFDEFERARMCSDGR